MFLAAVVVLPGPVSVGPAPPVVARALELLAGNCIYPNAPIATFHRPPCRTGFCDVPVARVVWETGTVEVNDASEPFTHGDVVAIAAALAHEFWHVAHGREELAAYEAQLAVLKALSAGRRTIALVSTARRAAAASDPAGRR